MPSAKHTAELAAEPRPWHRMCATAREAHDVVHGEEVGLVAQPRDQSPVPSRSAGSALRRASALVDCAFGQRAWMPSSASWRSHAPGVCPSGTSSCGYAYAELPSVERAARGDAQRLGEQLPADRSPPAPAACAGGVRHWGTTRVRPARAWCDGGSRSSCPATRGGCARACARRRWRPRACPVSLRQRQQCLQSPRIVRAAMQLHRQPQATGERCLQPLRHPRVGVVAARQPQREQARQAGGEVVAQPANTRPCRAAPARRGDQLGTGS